MKTYLEYLYPNNTQIPIINSEEPNLQDLYEDKTLIVISHRLSTIQQVDEVICLDEGSVVEQGVHEGLMEKKGYYWRLFRKQLIA